MGIFGNLFSKTPPPPPPPPAFVEGDIFYTILDGQYHICKLLRHEEAFETYHVLSYEPVDQLPAASAIDNLEVSCYHSPIYSKGFDNPKLLAKSTVSDSDLYGYRVYIVETNNVNERVRLAKQYYQEGYALTTAKLHTEAIEKYTLAIELIPNFFEAIDNRAFCKMDLGLWQEAILDFEQSLSVNPGSLLAEFSIGECYLRLKDAKKAVQQFEKALAIDPTHKGSQNFLVKARALEG